MSLILVKHFSNCGWVGIKNRNRTFKPELRIRKSYRNNVERLLLWDHRTKHTEGINEYGIAVLSTANDDARENYFFSVDAFKVRSLLFAKTISEALQKSVELKITGNTVIFDKMSCYTVKYSLNGSEPIVEQLNYHDGCCIGYSSDELDYEDKYKRINQEIGSIADPVTFFDRFSLMTVRKEGRLKTTGQLMIVPAEMTLHYRAMWCSAFFDMDRLNQEDDKTFFEIVSTRKLLSFKEL